jgi:hypothetical protein
MHPKVALGFTNTVDYEIIWESARIEWLCKSFNIKK